MERPRKRDHKPYCYDDEKICSCGAKFHNETHDIWETYHNYKMQQYQKQVEEVRSMLKEQIRKLQEYVGGE